MKYIQTMKHNAPHGYARASRPAAGPHHGSRGLPSAASRAGCDTTIGVFVPSPCGSTFRDSSGKLGAAPLQLVLDCAFVRLGGRLFAFVHIALFADGLTDALFAHGDDFAGSSMFGQALLAWLLIAVPAVRSDDLQAHHALPAGSRFRPG